MRTRKCLRCGGAEVLAYTRGCSAYMAATKADHGYAEVVDVEKQPGKGNQADVAESFWSGNEACF